MVSMQGSLPRIDLAVAGIDVDAAAAGHRRDDSRWATVRAAVFEALCEHGCFEAVVDGDGGRLTSPELSAAVLGPGGAVESLLSLPASTKARNASDMPYRGYVGSVLPGGVHYESLNIVDPLSPDAVRAFADLMWPDTGNAGFCTSVHAYAEKMAVVEGAVRRMVLESVGATTEYIEELAKTTSLKLRLTEYAAPDGGGDGEEGPGGGAFDIENI
ncbi:hypothetical protein BS78_08G092900 [Paspalum vaginatum]|nr:hypothetical protein BS78_08G092900 [Paspalum vaginatum]